MLYVRDVVVASIYLLFPLTVYYFYVAYNKKIEVKENSLVFGFILFSSMYLILCLGTLHYPRTALLIANIPIILAYSKKKWKEALLLSLMYIITANSLFQISFLYIISEYILYLIVYFIYSKKGKINCYLFATLFFISKTILYILRYNVSNHFFDDSVFNDNLSISIPLIYLTTLLILYIVKLGDDIMSYHMSYRDLVREKQIRTSLFKITHEIKNPLAVCKGYLDMIDVNDKNQCIKYIPIIKSEIDHTLLILKDFSSFSKINITKDIMDINYLISEVIYNYEEILESKNIKIINNCDDEIYIEADYTRLMQVFINIIKNAIEAVDINKKSFIKFDEKIDKKYIYIIVEDNGIGIEKENLDKIMLPFFTTKKNGTGLGISLSNEILISHGGSITYTSVYEEGTKIVIKLPKK